MNLCLKSRSPLVFRRSAEVPCLLEARFRRPRCGKFPRETYPRLGMLAKKNRVIHKD